MNQIRAFACGLFALAGIIALAGPGSLAAQSLGEDFSGDWGLYYTILDNAGVGEQPLTPTADAANRSLNTWGGYCPIGSPTQGGIFFGDDALPTLIPTTGSLFGVIDPATVGNGFVIFGAYPAAGGPGVDETGGYIYTVFDATPADLSGSGRIQFDASNGTGEASADIALRIMLRVADGGTPAWILSESIPLTGATVASLASPPASGSIFSDAAVVDVAASALAWTQITAPDDSVLAALAPDDEAPLTLGSAVAAPDLSSVTGLGLWLATDISRGDAYGVGIDAIRLTSGITAVADYALYR